MLHDKVIQLAQEAHQRHWRMSSDASTGDKLAAAVTANWQDAVAAAFPDGRFVPEHPVRKLRERIDFIDLTSGIAYELKVSPKTTTSGRCASSRS
jgi:hypothetical protein